MIEIKILSFILLLAIALSFLFVVAGIIFFIIYAVYFIKDLIEYLTDDK